MEGREGKRCSYEAGSEGEPMASEEGWRLIIFFCAAEMKAASLPYARAERC